MPRSTLRPRHTMGPDEPFPFPVLMGNGEIVTSFGPTGYHGHDRHHHAMEVVVFAGRRTAPPVPGLLRLGCFHRQITVDGALSEPRTWRQELVPRDAILLSRLEHESIREETASFVRLDKNEILFQTRLTNTSRDRIRVWFGLRYDLGDWNGQVPRDSHFHHDREHGALVFKFIMDGHAGGVYVKAQDGARSGDAKWDIRRHSCVTSRAWTLQPGESASIEFLFGFGDRTKLYYAPEEWSFDEYRRAHIAAWRAFHRESEVDLGEPELEALREICMYDLRCNSTPWSIPPAVTPAHWEGRTFHDELYPFLGLISGGHTDLAKKIPYYRLNTLDKAVERSGWRGARFPWEATEQGDEGASYGAWLGEEFHMGQFAEAAWRYWLHTGDENALAEMYPLLREIADYYLLNIVEPDGKFLRVRACTDYDESNYPVENGMYTAAAAVRSFRLAAMAAQELGLDRAKVKAWLDAADRLQRNLPRHSRDDRYVTCAGAEHHHIAEVGPIFPFRIDTASKTALNTASAFDKAADLGIGWKPGDLPAYAPCAWLWIGSHLATVYSLLGDPDRAWEILKKSPNAAGAMMAPVESKHIETKRANAPWFTTSAGAYVFALHNLFVQAEDDGTTRLPILPKTLANCSYRGLSGARGIRVDAEFKDGRCVLLCVRAPHRMTARLVLAKKHFGELAARMRNADYFDLEIELKRGRNVLLPVGNA